MHIEAPRLGFYSVDWHIRHLKGHPGWVLLCGSVCRVFDGPGSLLFSCQCWRVVGREAMVTAPPPPHDSAVSPCFHGCPAFLHRHFPPQSLPSHPLNPSLCSQHQLSPWNCSTISKFQLPTIGPSKVCMAVARTDSQSEGKFLIYPAIDQLFPSQP